MDSRRYRPNSPPVLQETVDDDTIIVDLESGTYYHLAASGAYVWRSLEAGATVGQSVDRLSEFYGVERAEAETAVSALVADLLSERLLIEADDDDGDGADETAVPEPSSTAYKPPALAKHTDMQELLLLDPVHDVDETGWPAAG